MQKNLRDKKFKKDIFGKLTQNYRIFIKKKRGWEKVWKKINIHYVLTKKELLC